jgi:hypothetical protein
MNAVDWDVLILLDACRYDVLAEMSQTAVIEDAISPGSSTPDFLQAAAETGVFDETVYVSGNPQSGNHSPGALEEHIPVYQRHWNEALSTVQPADIYDTVRENLDRGQPIVAHTLQPHYPHICRIGSETMPVPGGIHPSQFDEDWFQRGEFQSMLANGLIDLERAQRSYQASVKYAWDSASEFAAELTSEGYRVVITADHGELFGEHGFVEHPVGVDVSQLVRVPWIVFEPTGDHETPNSITDRLEALGYT